MESGVNKKPPRICPTRDGKLHENIAGLDYATNPSAIGTTV